MHTIIVRARTCALRRAFAKPARSPELTRALIVATSLLMSACGDDAALGEGDTHEESGAYAQDEANETGIVHITGEQAAAAGVRIEQAAISSAGAVLDLPAEIRFDPDRLARVSVPISGVVSDVAVSEGDSVRRGQTLAVIVSRELAELKSDYLDAISAERLANREAEREEVLWKEHATSEASVQTRRAALARATAAREAAETKLHAIDIGHEVLDNLAQSADGSRANFQLRSPLAGQVVQRDATMGEAVGSGEEAEKALFVVADASVVWADIAVYRQDLGRVEQGQKVSIIGEDGEVVTLGEVTYISPVIDAASRTATARAVLDNSSGRLRPGQFVTARLELSGTSRGVTIAQAAVQSIETGTVVFVPHEDGFIARPVITGRTSAGQTEILSGLAVGERYVAEGAFTLKSELEKSAFGDGHAH